MLHSGNEQAVSQSRLDFTITFPRQELGVSFSIAFGPAERRIVLISNDVFNSENVLHTPSN